MGSIAALFQQGGFLQQNAGSISSVLQAATQVAGGVQARGQARKNAKELERRGKQAEAQGVREAIKLKGRQRARFAKAGVQPDEGTALDVQLESEEQARLAARRRRMAFEGEADVARDVGAVALLQGLFGGGSTLLGAVRQQGATESPAPVKQRSANPAAVLGRLP